MSKSAQNLSTRVLILLLALTSIFLLLDNIGAADEPQAVSSHVVQPGDTLWSIAEGIAAPGSDIREVVSDVKALNSLATSSLQIGQSLIVPAG
jgi:LysM repeat protein